MVWNCQGAGHPRFNNFVKEYRRDFSPDMFYFLETRVSGARADRIIGRMGFTNSFRVETTGFSGGYGCVGMTL